jgi:hypothetical protein
MDESGHELDEFGLGRGERPSRPYSRCSRRPSCRSRGAPRRHPGWRRPVFYGAIRQLLTRELHDSNRKRVHELSDGKLGYIHVARMVWPDFQKFEEEIYSEGYGKDGLIIDVRDNGGGFTTDHLLTVLTQPQHAYTVPRGGGVGYPVKFRFVGGFISTMAKTWS